MLYAKFYPYALTQLEIYLIYQEERLLFMSWLQRLVFWVKQTWLLLRGKRHFVWEVQKFEVLKWLKSKTED